MTPDTIHQLYQEGISASRTHDGDIVRPEHPQYATNSPEYAVWLLGFDHGIQTQRLHQCQAELLRSVEIVTALKGFKRALSQIGE